MCVYPYNKMKTLLFGKILNRGIAKISRRGQLGQMKFLFLILWRISAKCCSNAHNYQQWRRISFPQHPCLYLFDNLIMATFFLDRLIFSCSSNFHFSNGHDVEQCFHGFIGHLYFFWEVLFISAVHFLFRCHILGAGLYSIFFLYSRC